MTSYRLHAQDLTGRQIAEFLTAADESRSVLLERSSGGGRSFVWTPPAPGSVRLTEAFWLDPERVDETHSYMALGTPIEPVKVHTLPRTAHLSRVLSVEGVRRQVAVDKLRDIEHHARAVQTSIGELLDPAPTDWVVTPGSAEVLSDFSDRIEALLQAMRSWGVDPQ